MGVRNLDLKKINTWELSLNWKGFLTHKVEEIVALVKVSLLYVRVLVISVTRMFSLLHSLVNPWHKMWNK